MGVLNVRIDDHVLARLKVLAAEHELTLSDFVRDLLREAVIPIADRSDAHGDQEVPESFPLRDRLVLSLLHRILARVLPVDASGEDGDEDYQLQKAKILESGFTGQYWLEVAGFETELSRRDSERVLDILDMYRVITFSIERLAEAGTPADDNLVRRLRFQGFDHNDALEGHMARYVKFMMSDEERWEELTDQVRESDHGNSHRRMLEVYQRMLSEFRRVMDSRTEKYHPDAYLLSVDELGRLADAQIHPSHRE